MKRLILLLTIINFFSYCTPGKKVTGRNIDAIAEKYVRLGLAIGQYDADFVDAYYGPDSLRPTGKTAAAFPKQELQSQVASLIKVLFPLESQQGDVGTRARWMHSQLIAFDRRIKIFTKEYAAFDVESRELFGVEAPHYNEQHFKTMIEELDKVLPGTGTITNRVESLSKEFTIPTNKLDAVFTAAIAEARKRTLARYKMPASETFTLEYVTGKPWSGYNWYKGNYKSVIQINTDLPIYIERAIDLACHEGYPGHHVYNVLLEKNLYRDKGWLEISLYPLFSPQSIIAEGSANYGIEVAFPGNEKYKFAKEVLFPIAGLDTSKADVYFKMLELKGVLNYSRNEAARGFINGTLSEAEALRWLTSYSLYTPDAAKKSLSFIKGYRSYVINYNYGQDMIKTYIESKGGTATNINKRWDLFEWILSNPITPAELINSK